MKPVITPDQAGEVDRATQAAGTPAAVLMERAGRAVSQAVVDRCGGVYGRRVVVLCGKGNNGGDGLVAARDLARRGMRVEVVAMEPLGGLREPAMTNLARLGEQGIVPMPFSTSSLRRELTRADVAVDAIVGTGFRSRPAEDWVRAIEELAAAGVPVVSVDIPSGVDGRTGAVEGDAVRAELTVTFGAAKVGNVLLPGAEHAGAVRVVDIGFADGVVTPEASLVEPGDVARVLPVRAADTHKRASGVVMVVAGSRGMTGAPSLIVRAAGRMGAGLLHVAAPGSILQVLQGSSTEAVYLPLPETVGGTVAVAALEPALEALSAADVLAIGPGLTRQAETAGFVHDLVRASPVPVVLDADGLNAFEGRAGDLVDRKADLVITPHEGEFARLASGDPGEMHRDRLRAVRDLAADTAAVVLLKGTRTLVADAGGAVRINPTGSAVLATAGSGDVLTGVIGALLARGVEPVDAASAAAYVHGVAGGLAGNDLGEGALASDIADRLPAAIAEVMRA